MNVQPPPETPHQSGQNVQPPPASGPESPVLPPPFGLENPHQICHFNSLLQALVGCPAIAEVVGAHRGYLAKTQTGRAFCEFYDAMAAGKSMDRASSRLLAALIADLRRRRPQTAFGNSQESASEGLILLLDMITHEPPHTTTAAPAAKTDSKTATAPTAKTDAKTATAPTAKTDATPAAKTDAKTAVTPAAPDKRMISPLSRLFEHRYTCFLICLGCRRCISQQIDIALQFMLNNPAELGKALLKYTQPVEDYKCPECQGTNLVRHYKLACAPRIIVCCFNIYGQRPVRDIPRGFEFAGAVGEPLIYGGHSQVTHRGTTSGGHYTAVSLRETEEGPAYFRFDDSAEPAPADWADRSANVYMAIYCRA